MDSKTLTHLNEQGEARMVDVGDKEITARRAVAQGRIVMQPSTLDLIPTGGHAKGDGHATPAGWGASVGRTTMRGGRNEGGRRR